MTLDLFVINAFATEESTFSGSPAGVCLLESFLPDETLQAIAAQNNLPETAFIVKDLSKGPHDYQIRWFAPNQEVGLVGHATLATAYVLFHEYKIPSETLKFYSRTGILLEASKKGDLIELNFPAQPFEKTPAPEAILKSIQFTPIEVLGSLDYLVVLENESQIKCLEVDQSELCKLDRRGVVFTAPGTTADIVSRVFHPKLGIGEDPACGSAHCEIIPYWAERLGKSSFHTRQLASRPAEFFCEFKPELGRVFLQGRCQVYLRGKISSTVKFYNFNLLSETLREHYTSIITEHLRKHWTTPENEKLIPEGYWETRVRRDSGTPGSAFPFTLVAVSDFNPREILGFLSATWAPEKEVFDIDAIEYLPGVSPLHEVAPGGSLREQGVWLSNLYVPEKYRAKGLAGILAMKVCAELEKLGTKYIHVWTTAPEMMTLYDNYFERKGSGKALGMQEGVVYESEITVFKKLFLERHGDKTGSCEPPRSKL